MRQRQEGRVTIEDGVVYGTGGDRDLHGDVFLPPEAGVDRPAIVLVHGGGWATGDRTQLRGYGIQLARYGFVCVAIEYRLSGEAVWPAQIDDVAAAFDWLRANAATYGVDPDRIAVSGNSAGAHLALMLGARRDVAAVVAIYAPTLLRVAHPQDMVGALLGGTVSREVEDGASPVSVAHAGYPPTMLVHGNADDIVPVDASFAMYHALVAAGARCDLHVFHGEPHAFDAAPPFGRQVVDLIAHFVDRHTGG